MQSPKKTTLAEATIPEINGDRCVHAHIETASCTACVTACPVNAWILNDESLGLNTEACDGCGLCVPACSEGAILQIQNYTIRDDNQNKVLLLGCENTGLKEANCVCIHSLSYTDLFKLKRDGIHQIQVSTGDCKSCFRGGNETLSDRINQINKMLRHSELPQMQYQELTPQSWQQLWKTPEKSAPGPEMNRRTFFRSALKLTVNSVMHTSIFDNSEEFIPLGEMLAINQNNDQIFPAVPEINPEKCNGCDACLRACPHSAISYNQEKDTVFYALNSAACTACNICVDICEENAIQVLHWDNQTHASIRLVTQKCKSCGVDYHYPEDKHENNQLCLICRHVNHHKNLFQLIN